MKQITSKSLAIIVLFVLTVCWVPVASQAAPDLINYQGLLNDINGDPVSDDNVPMSFRIYNAKTSGTLLWMEEQTVTVVGGIYSVLLGSGNTIVGTFGPGLFSVDTRWLEVVVSGETLSPRQQITSVAFSLTAQEAGYAELAGNAETVGGMSPEDILPAGTTLGCPDGMKMIGINSSTGDVICGSDIDTYNSAFDTEAEIDAAVANNNYSTGPHTTDTNARTICPNGYFLNGDGSCDQINSSGDCLPGQICGGGHTHTQYNDADNITAGTLNTKHYDAYNNLSLSGRLNNNAPTDILTQTQLDSRYTRNDLTRTGYLFIDAATMTTMTTSSNTLNYGRLNGGVYTFSPSTHWYGTGNVDLPDGATITGLYVYYYDNDTTNNATFRCNLYRREYGSLGVQLIAQITKDTAGTNANVLHSTTITMTPGTAIVSETNYTYFVYASGTSMENSSNLAHMGCRIEFTYTNPYP